MTKHVKVLELDKTEYEFGLNNPLTIKYRDKQNALVEFDYSGGVAVEGSTTEENPDGNNNNTIDLSGGVYYATTSTTASRVANSLIVKDSVGNIITEYNGSVPNSELILPGVNEISYEDLKRLRDESKLTPGEKYRINDYDTIVNGYNVANHPFDIIVEALDKNSLSEHCCACVTKRDVGDRTGEAFNWGSVGNWINNRANDNDPFPIVQRNFNFYKNLSGTRRNIFHQLGTRGKADNNTNAVKVTLTYASGEPVDCVGVYVTKANDSVVIGHDYHRGQCSSNQNENNVYYIQLPQDNYTGQYAIYFCIATENETTDNVCAVNAEWYTGSYFNDNIPSSWEIKYSLDNDTNRFDWANTNGKGVIYYMKDKYENEAPYDFKNILIDGKYTFNYRINEVNYDGSVKYGDKCFGNKLCSDATAETSTNKPGLPKIVFNNTSANAICKFNTFSNNAWNISFGNGCYYNEFIGKCENISLGNNCFMNVFHEDCVSNTLGDDCSQNTFGNKCENNKLDYNCTHNTFDNNCTGNTLKTNCSYNKFDTFCKNNYLYMECDNNTFGNNCTGNKLAGSCTNNKLGSNCTGNMFGVNCASNELDNDCEANILGCNSSWQYPTNISDVTEGSCNGNKFGNNCVKIYLQNACMYNVFAAKCGIDMTDTKVGNKFGIKCVGNTFGIYCAGNTFGNNCSYNNFDDYAQNNTFGVSCQSNIFGVNVTECSFGDTVLRCKVGSKSNNCKISTTTDGTTLLDYIKSVEFGNECSNVNLYVNDTSTTYLQNYRIANGLTGNIQITGNNPRGRSYITSIGKDSSGVTVQKCLEDVKKSINTEYSAGKLTISLI